MTILETRRYAMLNRVRDFGEVHRDLFPESSEGGQAFATVAAAVTKLGTHTRSRMTSTRDGQRARVAAREALGGRLDVIARTARSIAEKTPGFDDPFRLPRKQDDESLLIAMSMFIDEAEARKERFVRHGLSETFITDVKAIVEQLAQAVRAVAAAKERSKVARKGIAAAELSAFPAVRQLDVIVANQLAHDPDALAHWQEVRKVGYRRRASAAQAEQPETPVAPPAPTMTSSAAVATPSTSAEADAGQIQLPKAS